MGVVTWFTVLTNQMHSAWSVLHFTFHLPQFRILQTPSGAASLQPGETTERPTEQQLANI